VECLLQLIQPMGITLHPQHHIRCCKSRPLRLLQTPPSLLRCPSQVSSRQVWQDPSSTSHPTSPDAAHNVMTILLACVVARTLLTATHMHTHTESVLVHENSLRHDVSIFRERGSWRRAHLLVTNLHDSSKKPQLVFYHAHVCVDSGAWLGCLLA
jgi:hypothetical protein